MRYALVLIAAVLVSGCSAPAASQPTVADQMRATEMAKRQTERDLEWQRIRYAAVPVQGHVTKVTDGDTIHVAVDGQDVDVRVLGIDTPETKKPGTPIQCGGLEATQFAHQHLDGQTVGLTADPTQAPTDRYKRALRYITLPDGTDYSVAIASAGWARSYVYGHKPVEKQPEIARAQADAQAAHRGIWGLCSG